MISVIIPTYNRKEKLKRAINSVLNQTFKEFEILIIDNGSTDGTIELLREMKKQYSNYINYYVNLQKGANYSRNLGIEKSRGNYIAFLDDDDEWEKTKLEKQNKIMHQNVEIGLCYTGKKIINEDFNLEYISYSSKLKNIYIENFIGTTSSVLIRKNILEKSGKFDVKLPALQDYDLWIRILEYTKSYELKEPLIKYYIASNNSQISNSISKFEEACELIDEKNLKNLNYLQYRNERENRREEEKIIKLLRGKNLKYDTKKFKNKIKYLILKIIGIKKILIIKKIIFRIVFSMLSTPKY